MGDPFAGPLRSAAGMRRFPRKKRGYTILFFVFLVAVIFLCFQLISFKVLHQQSHLKETHHEDAPIFQEAPQHLNLEREAHDQVKNCMIEGCNEEEDDEDVLLVESNDKRLSQKHLNNIVAEAMKQPEVIALAGNEDVWTFLERAHDIAADIHGEYVLGINRKWSQFYGRNNGTFRCITSKEMIPFSHLNDDYCDCEDHSDEPGTAACQNSRFYCRFQLSHGPAKWVPSSCVGDGLCDCCDGSDEWQEASLPDHVQLNDGAVHNGIRQAPCSDHCQELRQQDHDLQMMRKRGSELKKAYIEAAKDQIDSSEYYGPKNVFYKLSLECFSTKADKYKYELCPFRKAEQQDGSAVTNIGRSASWITKDPLRGYKLRMTGGDTRGCPDHGSRETIVLMQCGLTDAIVSLSEAERCLYHIDFITPAAC
ncbi:hypothetical protein CAPTEDRAFT_200240 [Capitella teleta]|uniref:Glucosidase 2 subunit beta n=1 Tax=Capitella teleta TaxID=283909 RepID=R7V4V1_CAPTE|nr:hypothetical protein CAPTEDRAFT_200240 [Capitella teleta]|eukprot:ELU10800.1 hypothetical protein CAPTEDRAFT_200240 [Capitella teleta]